jgi:AraC-like DNA-binding protein
VPLIGGSSIIYATMITQGEVCIYENLCTDVLVFKQLYNIFSGSLTFLLTVFVYDRMVVNVEGTAYQRQHKYALVLALIILNLALLAITLAQITGNVDAERGALADTIVRIGFIYLVLTSVFRVFAYPVEIDYERIPTIRPRAPSDRDLALADKVRTVLGQEKIYRMMELDREKFASKLAVSEHYLSHVINKCLGQSFSTLISHYRVLEAKERLAREDTAITVIGFEVGFSSIPSFNRVFKQTAGMSPSEYRSAQKAAPKK